MDIRKTGATGAGGGGRSVFLYGCMAFVGVLVIISAAGVWAVYRAADGGASLTGGPTPAEVFRTGEGIAIGLMDGSIRPEEAIRVLCRIFTDMSDGVLTTEEIWDILKQLRRECGARL